MKVLFKYMGKRIRRRWWMVLLLGIIWGLYVGVMHPLSDTGRGTTFMSHMLSQRQVLEQGILVSQKICLERDNIDEIDVFADVNDKSEDTYVKASLTDEDGNLLAQSELSSTRLVSKKKLTLSFSPLTGMKGQNIILNLEKTGADTAQIGLQLTAATEKNEAAAVNGQSLEFALRTQQGFQTYTYRVFKILLIILLVLYSLLMVIFLDSQLERSFLLLAAGCSALILLNPFPHPVDESTHEFRALAISEGNIFDAKEDGEIGAFLPSNYYDTLASEGETISLKSACDNFDVLSQPLSKEKAFVSNDLMDSYIPLAHMPAALGNLIGRLFRLPVFLTIWLARLCSYLVYIFFAYETLKVMRHYQSLFFAIFVTPMMLSFATSITADTLVNTAAISLVGLCLHYRTDEEAGPLSVKHRILLLLCVLSIASIKYLLYTPVLLFYFLIPKEKFKSRKDWGALLAIALLLVFSMAGLQFWMLKTFPYVETRNGNVDVHKQVMYILQNKVTVFKRFTKFLLEDMDYFFIIKTYALHNASAKQQYFLPIIRGLCALLIPLTAIIEPDKYREWNRREEIILKTAIPVLAILVSYLITASLYVGYTPVGAKDVDGVVPRYFYPLYGAVYFWLSLFFPKASDPSHYKEKLAFWMLLGTTNLLCIGLMIK